MNRRFSGRFVAVNTATALYAVFADRNDELIL